MSKIGTKKKLTSLKCSSLPLNMIQKKYLPNNDNIEYSVQVFLYIFLFKMYNTKDAVNIISV